MSAHPARLSEHFVSCSVIPYVNSGSYQELRFFTVGFCDVFYVAWFLYDSMEEPREHWHLWLLYTPCHMVIQLVKFLPVIHFRATAFYNYCDAVQPDRGLGGVFLQPQAEERCARRERPEETGK